MPQAQALTLNADRQESWLGMLDALEVQFLVLDIQRDSKLFQLVRSNPIWTVDFSDGESVLLARAQVESRLPGAQTNA